jgi:hypothetical protein
MPYWISLGLQPLPAFLWMFVGVGLPWALALLPRKDWRDLPLVACVMLIAGAALTTTWMFVLGVIGGASQTPLMTPEAILIGTLAISGIGGLITFVRWRRPTDTNSEKLPLFRKLAFDETLVLGLIVIALVIRWLGITFWVATAYDELWVYGYQGRLYTLLKYIPQNIDYYPQFLSLQYAYAGILYNATLNAHIMRAGLIFLHIGSILSVYVLGARLFTRRIGLYAAALWAFYPHVGEWSRYGDLEIPQTFVFTAAAAFFLMAWFNQQPRRHYAALSGLGLGVALWTKPTAGAFIWGVILLTAMALGYAVWSDFRRNPATPQRDRWRSVWSQWGWRFEVAAICGVCCLPMGGMWYLRNALLGHLIITLPEPYWLTAAARSGAEFGWLLLGLAALLLYLYSGPHRQRPDWRGTLFGVGLILLGVLPSIIVPHRMEWLEWLALAAGVSVLVLTLYRHARTALSDAGRADAQKTLWALAFAAPYFFTWFYSYSYHYRLSFAIVPLLLLPTAVVLGRWLTQEWLQAWRPGLRVVYAAAICALALPAIIIPLYDPDAGWDWLWTDRLPDDGARLHVGNQSLMGVLASIWIYQGQMREMGQDTAIRVMAPAVQRLPYFFPPVPQQQIWIDQHPTRLSELEAAGMTHFLWSFEGERAYRDVPPLENQIVSALGRTDLMLRNTEGYDGNFVYEMYTLTLENRWIAPQVENPLEGEAVFGGFARLLGHRIDATTLRAGQSVTLDLYWQGVGQAADDYMIYLHLVDAEGNVVAGGDGPVARYTGGVSQYSGREYYYSTLFWEAGEYIRDPRTINIPTDAPLGEGYQLRVGFYRLSDQTRVPLTLDGEPAGDGVALNGTLEIVAP